MRYWEAKRQVYPSTRTQRFRLDKAAKVPDKLNRRLQTKAKDMSHEDLEGAMVDEGLQDV